MTSVTADDDLSDDEWQQKPRRRGSLTRTLVVLLLVILAFLGGLVAGRQVAAGQAHLRRAPGVSSSGRPGGAGSTGGSLRTFRPHL